MIARMQKDVAFVAAQRAKSTKPVVGGMSTRLLDDLFSDDDARFKEAQKVHSMMTQTHKLRTQHLPTASRADGRPRAHARTHTLAHNTRTRTHACTHVHSLTHLTIAQ